MSEDDWHGWRVNGMSLHVGHLPGRKSVCLYRLDSTRIEVLAYFRSEDHARRCLEVLDAMSG